MPTDHTNILCQHCTSVNAPDTIFCGNCGKLLNGYDKSTVHIPPQPPTSPTQKYSRTPPPTQPVVPRQPFWTRGKILVLSVSILLLLLFIGGVLISFAYQLGRNSVPGNTPQSTATTAPGTTATTTVPTTTATPTKVLTLTCSQCPGDPLLVTINKITVSSTRMIWDMTFTNQNGDSLTYDVSTFSLQDLTGGQPIDATGDILTAYGYYSTHALQKGQFDGGEVIFPFVPHVGIVYRLTVVIYANYNLKLSFDRVQLTCTNNGCQLG